MKGRFLIQVFILASFSILSGKCYSCYQDPTAVISGSDPRNVCVGETENFNGTSSHDNDEGGSSIVGYQWSCPDASVDSPTASSTDITFGNSGSYTVTLTVTDDESATDNDTCQVTVVEVDKVVEYGTTDEGPLYAVCPFETVLLEAKPNPSDAEFPPYEPHWTIVSQPGSSGSLSPPSPINHVKVLSGLTEPGTYVVRAKCGDSVTGFCLSAMVLAERSQDYS